MTRDPLVVLRSMAEQNARASYARGDRDNERKWLDVLHLPARPARPVGGAMSEQAGELRTPEEWCALLGARIADPDGWRDGTRGWDEPIGRAEFDRRLIRCTLDARGYPDFWAPPTTHADRADTRGQG